MAAYRRIGRRESHNIKHSTQHTRTAQPYLAVRLTALQTVHVQGQTQLQGRFVLQLNEVVNVGAPARDRYFRNTCTDSVL